MDKDQVGKAISIKKRQLIKWCKKAEAAQIEELSNFVTTAKTHSGFILNYFVYGATNAPAEALNRNIKKFKFRLLLLSPQEPLHLAPQNEN